MADPIVPSSPLQPVSGGNQSPPPPSWVAEDQPIAAAASQPSSPPPPPASPTWSVPEPPIQAPEPPPLTPNPDQFATTPSFATLPPAAGPDSDWGFRNQPPVSAPVGDIMQSAPVNPDGNLNPLNAPYEGTGYHSPNPPAETGSFNLGGQPEVSPTPDMATPPPPTFSTPTEPPPPAEPMAVSFQSKRGGGFKTILLIILIFTFLGGLGWLAYQYLLPQLGLLGNNSDGTPTGTEEIRLTYWGLWEPNQVLQAVFDEYSTSHPNIKVVYEQQSYKDYRERLQSALSSGTTPDVFRYHNTWLPMLYASLAPDDANLIDLNQYYPVVAKDVSAGGKVYGVPLGFDTLALYYNPAMLSRAGQSVPSTWEGLRTVAQRLRVPADPNQPIQVAGVALGTTRNVDHFSDILGLMLLQNGADPGNPTNKLTEDALLFYSLFSITDRVWDDSLPSSTYAFATEKVGMMLAPSWRAFDIKAINPNLEFATAPVPQLPGEQIAWASYWVEGVSQASTHKKEAWELLQYLASDAVLTKLYTAQSQVRLFGEPYPKPQLAASLEADPIVGTFVKQGPYAKSWYLASKTWDNGLNDRMIQYYENAINQIRQGGQPDQALPTLAQGVTQVLNQFGIATTQAPVQTGTSGNQFPVEPQANPDTSSTP